MHRLGTIAHRPRLLVGEAAAQALGARLDGRMAGSFGATGCFSFYPFKARGGNRSHRDAASVAITTDAVRRFFARV
jgi:hypothetical protein